MTYVALLRGVNVGGTGAVEMKALKAVFEAAGMESVRTYINSGNVVFSTGTSDRAALTGRLESAIAARFGFPVDVLVRDADEVRSIVSALLAEWANDAEAKCDVLFLWDDVDSPDVLKLLDHDPAVDDLRYTPGAVLRRVERKNAARSKLARIVGTPVYRRMTIRNCNTARKLLDLMTA